MVIPSTKASNGGYKKIDSIKETEIVFNTNRDDALRKSAKDNHHNYP